MKLLAITLFLVTYFLMLAIPKHKTFTVLVSASIFILLGIIPFSDALAAIDWNAIMIIGGTMGVVFLFIESRMPALLGDLIIERTPNIKWAIVFLALFSGFISAFVDNVATVLMLAPVALNICKRLNISPVSSIIAIAVSSNLQGAATLVGDTTSILLSAHTKFNFMDFFFFQGKFSIFWVVQAGALTSALVLLYLFRDKNQPMKISERTEVRDYFPSFLLVGVIVLLIIASFIPNRPELTNGFICVGLFIVGLVRELIVKRDLSVIIEPIKEIDYHTLLLLTGLFIIIGGITEAGVIDDLSRFLARLGKDNLLTIFTVIVWFSVFVSAFIDNIPYVATMLPVVGGIASILNVEPYLFYFGLLVGATLGGNLTPIGASTNIAALGILRKEGYTVSTKEFMAIGVPFTLVAVTTGYLLLWFLWS